MVDVAGQTSAASTDTTSYALPVISGVALPDGGMATDGGDTIEVTGTNFGPIGGPAPELAYGVEGGATFSATSCSVTQADTTVACQSAAGAGAGLVLQVTITGQSSSVSSQSIDYDAPTVSGVSASELGTAGTGAIVISGANFGPTATNVVASYGGAAGTDFDASDCSVTTPHTEITCTAGVGVGADHRLVVGVAGVQSALSAVGVGVSYAAPSISGLSASPSPTAGGQDVVITGSNFGTAALAAPSATYGDGGAGYSVSAGATGCRVTVAHTQITCRMVAGSGTGHTWRVTVGGQPSPVSAATTSYARPQISSLSSSTLSTAGGTDVVITGSNFGADGDGVPSATYGDGGSGFSVGSGASACRITTDHTEVTCRSVAGVGGGHSWILTVSGQASDASSDTTSYTAPAISGISVQSGSVQELPTAGGTDVVITGTNFGASGQGVPSATYGPGGSGFSIAAGATACRITVDHTEVTCRAVAGVGTGHTWVLTISGQSSSVSAQTSSYAPPSITGLSVQSGSLTSLPTQGGTDVIVTGNNFGAIGQGVPSASYGGDGTGFAIGTGATACRITADHTEVTCRTAAGAGSGHSWILTISGQESDASSQTTSYASPSITSLAVNSGSLVTLPTAGGRDVVITGTNFGPSGIAVPSATYGAGGTGFSIGSGASACRITTDHTEVTCRTVAGVGTGHAWILTITDQASAVSSDTSSYAAPAITGLSVQSGSLSALPTSGGTDVVISGTNFGTTAIGASPTATYGADGTGNSVPTGDSGCRVTTAHTEITCRSVAGVGTSHQWIVRVGGQDSAPSTDLTSYARPSVTAVAVSGAVTLSTSGGTDVVISGENFGADGVAVPSATYGSSGTGFSIATGASGCRVTVDHTEITCRTVVGVGASLSFILTTGGQTSDPSSDTVSYGLPTISSFSAPGGEHSLTTAGGTDVVITGTNFGTDALALPTATYGDSGTGYSVANGATGCRVTVAHTQITCRTVAGSGALHTWRLTVGGQTGPVSGDTTSYARPAITGLSSGTLPTEGGIDVVITGTNFGAAGDAVPTATYGDDGAGFSISSGSTGCRITNDHTEVTCRTVAGVGAALTWIITISGQASDESSATTSYTAPAISGLAVQSGSLIALETEGGTDIVITGTNFGTEAVGATPSATYGQGGSGYSVATGSSGCRVTNDHTEITCRSVAGVGASHQWIVRVGDQDSSPSTQTTSYGRPVISSIDDLIDGSPMSTVGGETLQLHGTNFGPVGTAVTAVYGPGGSGFTAVSCSVEVAHTRIACVSAAGAGAGHGWVVTLGGQSSEVSSGEDAESSYAPPSISSRTGGTSMATSGGATVTFHGSNMGPVGTTVTATYGGSDGTKYSTTCTVPAANPHTRVECTSVAGIGSNLGWIVSVAGQPTDVTTGSRRTSYTAPSISSLSGTSLSALPTAGGTTVTIEGNNFGPSSEDIPSVSYGSESATYEASDCVMTVEHTTLECDTIVGTGASHEWRVVVGGQTSAVAPSTTSYARPSISSLSGSGLGSVSTSGGVAVTISGTNFGTSSTAGLVVTVGSSSPTFSATCTFAVAHTTLSCTVPAGVGANLAWIVTVGGQDSDASTDTTTYTPPQISALSGTGITSMTTSGGTEVVITGTNFGPIAGHTVTATYGSDGSGFSAVGCQVTEAHTEITCESNDGVGAGLLWRVVVGSQLSPASTDHTSYQPPEINSIVGGSALVTSGNELVTINGDQFGPVSTPVAAVYGPGGAGYVATDCEVTVAHVRVQCRTAAGIGAGHGWVVTVGDQDSAVSTGSALTSYAAPSISGLSGTSIGSLPTTGGIDVTIEGLNFGGSSEDIPVVTYGPGGTEYTAESCTILIEHTRIRCETVAGVGAGHTWQITVGQQSGTSSDTTAYAPPSISSLVPSSVDALATSDVVEIQVNGENFGPSLDDSAVVFKRENPDLSFTMSCVMSIAHTRLTCDTVPAVGQDLRIEVTTGSQASELSSGTISYSSPSISSVSIVDNPTLPTEGGVTVNIVGANFGPDVTQNDVRAFYGDEDIYEATDCVFTVQHTALQCTSAVGVGVDHTWRVLVGGQYSTASTDVTSYTRPTISSISGALVMDTSGGADVTLTGEDFGVSVGNVRVFYGPSGDLRYEAANCAVITPHTQVQCESVEGVGADLHWAISVGGQQSLESDDTNRYDSPAISRFEGSTLMTTAGGSTMTLTGTNFGPTTGHTVTATYGVAGDGATTYTATNCQVTVSHTRMTCDGAAGVGALHAWVVTVGGQASEISEVVTSYRAPHIESVTGGVGSLATTGGETLTVSGTDFGSADQVVTYGNSVYSYTASCTVTVAHLELSCDTVPGVGISLEWVLTVGGQDSNTEPAFSYTQPTVAEVRTAAASMTGLDTDEHIEIIVEGTNFGPDDPFNLDTLEVHYSNSGLSLDFQAVDCVMTQPHEIVRCTTVDGVGTDLITTITIGGQSSNIADAASDVISYAAPEISGVLVSSGDGFPTTGGATVRLTGANFGPTATFNVISAFYGAGDAYEAVDCDVSVAHTTVECTSVEGIGKLHAWRILVGGQYSGSSISTTTYEPPSIDILSGSFPMTTHGGTSVTLEGTNFGPNTVDNVLTVVYGPSDDVDRYTAASCTLITPHTEISCSSVEGTGAGHSWRVTIGTQESELSSGQSEYRAPEVVSVGNGDALATEGSEEFTLHGDQFGPVETPVSLIQVTYGSYAATSCSVTADHVVITCTSVAGVGADIPLAVVVDGQDTSDSAFISYSPPTIASVTGSNVDSMQTVGGDEITLTGANFGPASEFDSFVAGYGPLSSLDKYTASNCVLDTPHEAVTCETAPGVGKELRWIISVGGQQGVPSADQVRYEPPTLVTLDNSSAIPTSGGAVRITGTNFGPLGEPDLAGYHTNVPGGDPVLSSGCSVVVAHVEVECAVAPGVGFGHTWQVRVGGQDTNVGVNTTSYQPPRVESASTLDESEMLTSGAQGIVFRGSNFGLASDEYISVTYGPTGTEFQGLLCGVTTAHTEALCFSSEGQGKDLPIIVSVGGLESELSEATLSYGAPRITSRTPSMGPVNADGRQTPITVYGQNFGLSGTVDIGERSCDVFLWSHTQLQCDTPVTAVAGPQPITIAVAEQTNDPTANFSYFELSGFEPAFGRQSGGTTIRVLGAGFDEPAALHQVLLRRNLAEVGELGSYVDFNTMQFTSAPQDADPVVSFAFSGDNFQYEDLPGTFEYYSPPLIDWIVPRAGPNFGGSEIIIGGSFYDTDSFRLRFSSTTNADIDAAECSLLNATHARCVTLPNDGAARYFARISVDTEDSLPREYFPDVSVAEVEFQLFERPIVNRLDPPLGPVEGGTAVLLQGRNFVESLEGLRVWFGGVEISCSIQSDTAISCISPALNEGLHNVRMSLDDGRHWHFAAEPFRSYVQPTFVIDPPFSPIQGNAVLNVLGSGLYHHNMTEDGRANDDGRSSYLRVKVDLGNGETEQVADFVSLSQLKFLTPTVSGSTTVTMLVSLNGQDYTPFSFDVFYYPEPVLIDTFPHLGPTSGATEIDIEAEFFLTGHYTLRAQYVDDPEIYVDTNCTAHSNTSMTCFTPSITDFDVEEGVFYMRLSIDRPTTVEEALFFTPPTDDLAFFYHSSSVSIVPGSVSPDATLQGTAATFTMLMNVGALTAVTRADVAGMRCAVGTHIAPAETSFRRDVIALQLGAGDDGNGADEYGQDDVVAVAILDLTAANADGLLGQGCDGIQVWLADLQTQLPHWVNADTCGGNSGLDIADVDVSAVEIWIRVPLDTKRLQRDMRVLVGGDGAGRLATAGLGNAVFEAFDQLSQQDQSSWIGLIGATTAGAAYACKRPLGVLQCRGDALFQPLGRLHATSLHDGESLIIDWGEWDEIVNTTRILVFSQLDGVVYTGADARFPVAEVVVVALHSTEDLHTVRIVSGSGEGSKTPQPMTCSVTSTGGSVVSEVRMRTGTLEFRLQGCSGDGLVSVPVELSDPNIFLGLSSDPGVPDRYRIAYRDLVIRPTDDFELSTVESGQWLVGCSAPSNLPIGSYDVAVCFNGQVGTPVGEPGSQFTGAIASFGVYPKPDIIDVHPRLGPTAGDFKVVVIGGDNAFEGLDTPKLRLIQPATRIGGDLEDANMVCSVSGAFSNVLTCDIVETESRNGRRWQAGAARIDLSFDGGRVWTELEERFNFFEVEDLALTPIYGPEEGSTVFLDLNVLLDAERRGDIEKDEITLIFGDPDDPEAVIVIMEREVDETAALVNGIEVVTVHSLQYSGSTPPQGDGASVVPIFISLGPGQQFPLDVDYHYYDPRDFEVQVDPASGPFPRPGFSTSRTRITVAPEVGSALFVSEMQPVVRLSHPEAGPEGGPLHGDCGTDCATVLDYVEAMPDNSPLGLSVRNELTYPTFLDAAAPELTLQSVYRPEDLLRSHAVRPYSAIRAVSVHVPSGSLPASLPSVAFFDITLSLRHETTASRRLMADDRLLPGEPEAVSRMPFLVATELSPGIGEAGVWLTFEFDEDFVWDDEGGEAEHGFILEMTRKCGPGFTPDMSGAIDHKQTFHRQSRVLRSQLGGVGATYEEFYFVPRIRLHFRKPFLRALMPTQLALPLGIEEQFATYRMSISINGGVDFLNIDKPMIVYSNELEIRALKPETGPVEGGSQLELQGTLVSWDREIIARWSITRNSTVFYIYSSAQFVQSSSKQTLTAVTPPLIGETVRGQARVSVDVSMNGQQFAYADIRRGFITRHRFTYFDTPYITNVSKTSGPQIGGGTLVVQARNVLFGKLFRCRYSSIDGLPEDLNRIPQVIQTPKFVGPWGFAQEGTFECPIPSHPAGVVRVEFTNNGQQFHSFDTEEGALYEFLNCPIGYTAPVYFRECVECQPGTRASDDGTECVACERGEYNPLPAQLECQVCPERSRTAADSNRTSRSQCLCWDGHYALSESWTECLPCEDHSRCDGGWALPFPEVGYYRGANCSAAVSCKDEFLPCSPRASCPGLRSGECAEGYCGELCGRCCADYYLMDKYCTKCPDAFGFAWMVLVVTLHFLFLVMVYLKFRYSSRMGSWAVICTFLQSLSVLSHSETWSEPVLASVEVSVFSVGFWPAAFRGGFHFLNFYVAPIFFFPSYFEYFGGDCFGVPLDISDRLVRVVVAMPTQIGVLLLLYVIDRVMEHFSARDRAEYVKLAARAKARSQIDKEVTPFMRLCNATLIVLELNFLYTQLGVWRLRACTEHPDGRRVYDVSPHLDCPEGLSGFLSASAPEVWWAGFYLLLMFFLVMNPWVDRPSVKNHMAFLYKRFVNGRKKWGTVVMLRSCAVVWGALVLPKFVGNRDGIAVFQAGFTFALNLVALMLQLKLSPYKDIWNNHLEALSLATNMVLAIVGLVFSIDKADGEFYSTAHFPSETVATLFETVGVILPFAVVFIGTLLFVKELKQRRGFLSFKKEDRRFMEATDRPIFVDSENPALIRIFFQNASENIKVGQMVLLTLETWGKTHHIVREVVCIGDVDPRNGRRSFYLNKFSTRESPGDPPEFKQWLAGTDAGKIDGLAARQFKWPLCDWAGPIEDVVLFMWQTSALLQRPPHQDVDIIALRDVLARHSFLRKSLNGVKRRLIFYWLDLQRDEIIRNRREFPRKWSNKRVRAFFTEIKRQLYLTWKTGAFTLIQDLGFMKGVTMGISLSKCCDCRCRRKRNRPEDLDGGDRKDDEAADKEGKPVDALAAAVSLQMKDRTKESKEAARLRTAAEKRKLFATSQAENLVEQGISMRDLRVSAERSVREVGGFMQSVMTGKFTEVFDVTTSASIHKRLARAHLGMGDIAGGDRGRFASAFLRLRDLMNASKRNIRAEEDWMGEICEILAGGDYNFMDESFMVAWRTSAHVGRGSLATLYRGMEVLSQYMAGWSVAIDVPGARDQILQKMVTSGKKSTKSSGARKKRDANQTSNSIGAGGEEEGARRLIIPVLVGAVRSYSMRVRDAYGCDVEADRYPPKRIGLRVYVYSPTRGRVLDEFDCRVSRQVRGYSVSIEFLTHEAYLRKVGPHHPIAYDPSLATGPRLPLVVVIYGRVTRQPNPMYVQFPRKTVKNAPRELAPHAAAAVSTLLSGRRDLAASRVAAYRSTRQLGVRNGSGGGGGGGTSRVVDAGKSAVSWLRRAGSSFRSAGPLASSDSEQSAGANTAERGGAAPRGRQLSRGVSMRGARRQRPKQLSRTFSTRSGVAAPAASDVVAWRRAIGPDKAEAAAAAEAGALADGATAAEAATMAAASVGASSTPPLDRLQSHRDLKGAPGLQRAASGAPGTPTGADGEDWRSQARAASRNAAVRQQAVLASSSTGAMSAAAAASDALAASTAAGSVVSAASNDDGRAAALRAMKEARAAAAASAIAARKTKSKSKWSVVRLMAKRKQFQSRTEPSDRASDAPNSKRTVMAATSARFTAAMSDGDKRQALQQTMSMARRTGMTPAPEDITAWAALGGDPMVAADAAAVAAAVNDSQASAAPPEAAPRRPVPRKTLIPAASARFLPTTTGQHARDTLARTHSSSRLVAAQPDAEDVKAWTALGSDPQVVAEVTAAVAATGASDSDAAAPAVEAPGAAASAAPKRKTLLPAASARFTPHMSGADKRAALQRTFSSSRMRAVAPPQDDVEAWKALGGDPQVVADVLQVAAAADAAASTSTAPPLPPPQPQSSSADRRRPKPQLLPAKPMAPGRGAFAGVGGASAAAGRARRPSDVAAGSSPSREAVADWKARDAPAAAAAEKAAPPASAARPKKRLEGMRSQAVLHGAGVVDAEARLRYKRRSSAVGSAVPQREAVDRWKGDVVPEADGGPPLAPRSDDDEGDVGPPPGPPPPASPSTSSEGDSSEGEQVALPPEAASTAGAPPPPPLIKVQSMESRASRARMAERVAGARRRPTRPSQVGKVSSGPVGNVKRAHQKSDRSASPSPSVVPDSGRRGHRSASAGARRPKESTPRSSPKPSTPTAAASGKSDAPGRDKSRGTDSRRARTPDASASASPKPRSARPQSARVPSRSTTDSPSSGGAGRAERPKSTRDPEARKERKEREDRKQEGKQEGGEGRSALPKSSAAAGSGAAAAPGTSAAARRLKKAVRTTSMMRAAGSRSKSRSKSRDKRSGGGGGGAWERFQKKK